MSKITIIPVDKVVSIDGSPIGGLTITGIDSTVRAIQFDTATESGWVEYNNGNPNTNISSIAPYQAAIDAYDAADEIIQARKADPYYGMTLEQKEAVILGTYEAACQAAMDALAQSWGYDSVVSALTYMNSTHAQWRNEASALNLWRDSVWIWANAQKAEIIANPSLLPATPAEFVAEMPTAPARPVTP